MKKKLLATAIAGALVAPAGVLAAQDTSGMRYTSASEGFYASLRVQFNSGGENTDSAGNVTDNGIGIENSTSRFGVRGTNDLGGGWQGFYQYEAGVDIDDGGSLSTRLGHVGVRGGFGQLQVGTFWPQSYNWVHGSTDVANWASGHFVYTTLLPGRQSRALEYTTPDLNGFQAAAFIEMDPNRDGEGALAPADPDIPGTSAAPGTSSDPGYVASSNSFNDIEDVVEAFHATTDATERNRLRRLFYGGSPGVSASSYLVVTRFGEINTINRISGPRTFGSTEHYFFDRSSTDIVIYQVRDFIRATPTMPGDPGNPKDDNDIDLWSLSAKYSFHGFDTGVSYTVAPDGIEKSNGSRNDLSLTALRFGYAQDNWYVTSWYAEDNAGDDINRDHDTETFSLAAGVAVGKANLYAVYEAQERDNYTPEIQQRGGGYSYPRRPQHGQLRG